MSDEHRTYLNRSASGDAAANDLPDLGRIYKIFQAGATIVLSGLQRYWIPLAHFCNTLELELTQPTQANAYITPRGSRGFDVHFDTHEVFLLQVTGSKHWAIYRPHNRLPLPGPATQIVKEPGRPIMELDLQAGDSMYIPRGFPHGASSLDNTSIHLTIGVLSITWNQLVRGVVEPLLDTLPFRQSLPPGFAIQDGASLEKELEKRLETLCNAIIRFVRRLVEEGLVHTVDVESGKRSRSRKKLKVSRWR